MYLDTLNHKTIGIFGMGREGTALKDFFKAHLTHPNVIEIEENNLSDLEKCDVVFKSPGVSLYRPEIQSLKQKGIELSSATNLFMRLKKSEQKLIAVTGTKGKSTTASLLYHTLKHLGVSVGFGGNIGVPLINLLGQDFEWIVAELSSYQCADFVGNPDIGVLVNLYPEHLQWHGSHEQYYQDKINMIRQAKKCIVNADNAKSIDYTKTLLPLFFNQEAGIHVANGFFMNSYEELFSTDSLNLMGEHNLSNACAVLTVIQQMGLDLKKCEEAFKSFQSLPHRLEKIAEINGVSFIDDSISTTPETAVAGLKSFPETTPITLIVGGQDRGQDFSVLMDYLDLNQKRIRLIALPDTGEKAFKLAQQHGIESFFYQTMQQAVFKAKSITPAGGIVLLSPAAPSYNLYRNFEERGADFKKWVFSQIS